jgi:hypothetical protein
MTRRSLPLGAVGLVGPRAHPERRHDTEEATGKRGVRIPLTDCDRDLQPNKSIMYSTIILCGLIISSALAEENESGDRSKGATELRILRAHWEK